MKRIVKLSQSGLLGGQQEEGQGVVYHVQGEHHQSYFYTIYQEYLIHSLGLIISTPGLVKVKVQIIVRIRF